MLSGRLGPEAAEAIAGAGRRDCRSVRLDGVASVTGEVLAALGALGLPIETGEEARRREALERARAAARRIAEEEAAQRAATPEPAPETAAAPEDAGPRPPRLPQFAVDIG